MDATRLRVAGACIGASLQRLRSKSGKGATTPAAARQWSILGHVFRQLDAALSGRGDGHSAGGGDDSGVYASDAAACVREAFRIAGSHPPFIDAFDVLGPFPMGKTELDGDPVAALVPGEDVIAGLVRMGPPVAIASELVKDGVVTWSTLTASTQDGTVRVVPPGVDWQRHMQTMSALEVLEFQAWLIGDLVVHADGVYTVRCTGVPAMAVDGVWHVGDVYGRGTTAAVVELRAGLHHVHMRVRGKASASVGCYCTSSDDVVAAQAVPQQLKAKKKGVLLCLAMCGCAWCKRGLCVCPCVPTARAQIQQPSTVPDILVDDARAALFGEYVPVTVVNVGTSALLDPQFHAYSSKAASGTSGGVAVCVWTCVCVCVHGVRAWTSSYRLLAGAVVSAGIRLVVHPHQPNLPKVAAGQTLPLPLRLAFESADCPATSPQWRTCAADIVVPVASCPYTVTVAVSFRASAASEARVYTGAVTLSLRCRNLRSAALFSFLDHDGSVQFAAAVPPLPLPGRGASGGGDGGRPTVPVLLSFHGTGVSALSQAEAHKMKGPKDADYVFGVQGYWLVAPDRHGAHNWEYTGHWTVGCALYPCLCLRCMAAWVPGFAHAYVCVACFAFVGPPVRALVFMSVAVCWRGRASGQYTHCTRC